MRRVAARVAAIEAIADRMRTLPGVQSVNGASSLPLTGSSSVLPLAVEGGPPARIDVHFRAALPGFLSGLEVPILQGAIFWPPTPPGRKRSRS